MRLRSHYVFQGLSSATPVRSRRSFELWTFFNVSLKERLPNEPVLPDCKSSPSDMRLPDDATRSIEVGDGARSLSMSAYEMNEMRRLSGELDRSCMRGESGEEGMEAEFGAREAFVNGGGDDLSAHGFCCSLPVTCASCDLNPGDVRPGDEGIKGDDKPECIIPGLGAAVMISILEGSSVVNASTASSNAGGMPISTAS